MVTASAPAKVILFGEHAVVYGEPSLVGAVDIRTYVRVEKGRGVIKSDKSSDFRYVKKALELTFNHIGNEEKLDVFVRSEVPPSSGLGSSAAVSVATILAVSRELHADLSVKEIARLGHNVEKEVQGAASPTDTLASSLGGVLFIQPKREKYERIDAALPLVIGYTGIERSTKELVGMVRTLRDRFPAVVNPIIKNIGLITVEAKKRLETGEEIGELMNINHAMLEALGVCTRKLSEAVYAAREAGAEGAKITGAGGGGSMIAHAPKNQRSVVKAIEGCGCVAFKAPVSRRGARIEK